MILLVILIIVYNLHIKNKHFLKSFSVTLVAVILFEIIVDPYVSTLGFSNWSYYYHDLTIFLTLIWTFILIGVISLVDKIYHKVSELNKFWLYLPVITFFSLVVEYALVKFGLRFYSESTLVSSYGLFIPLTNVPIGLVFLIPAMFTLVITFIKYWEYILNSK